MFKPNCGGNLIPGTRLSTTVETIQYNPIMSLSTISVYLYTHFRVFICSRGYQSLDLTNHKPNK